VCVSRRDQQRFNSAYLPEPALLVLEIVLGLIALRGFKSRIVRFYQRKRRSPHGKAAGVRARSLGFSLSCGRARRLLNNP